jgi:1-acyl-sn-glycerol-3-phosphate acyltransferase
VTGLEFPIIGPALPHRGNFISTRLAQWCMRVAGWRIEGNFPDVNKLVIIVAPHTTNWDFFIGVAAFFALRLRIRFLIKNTVFRWPVAGILDWLGGIPVDRAAPHGDVPQAIESFAQRDRLALAITPEGTRRRGVPWHTGFYYIALGARVPIAPATFDYRERVVHLGPALYPGDDVEADLAKLKAFCTGGRPAGELTRY